MSTSASQHLLNQDAETASKKNQSLWSKMLLWQKFSIIQLSILLVQYFVTPFLYRTGYWSQEYLNQVVFEDWNKGAIIDVTIESALNSQCEIKQDCGGEGYHAVPAYF